MIKNISRNASLIHNENVDNSKKILNHIRQNPATHMRQIKRELDLSIGTVQYHLNKLEKSNRIISEKHSLHKYYFGTGLFKEKERNLLKILKHDTARQILMFILERKNPTQQSIVTHIKISAASVNWHINRLIDLGLVLEAKDGKYKKYQLSLDSNDLVNLLKDYYPEIWKTWSGKLVETFLSLSR